MTSRGFFGIIRRMLIHVSKRWLVKELNRFIWKQSYLASDAKRIDFQVYGVGRGIFLSAISNKYLKIFSPEHYIDQLSFSETLESNLIAILPKRIKVSLEKYPIKINDVFKDCLRLEYILPETESNNRIRIGPKGKEFINWKYPYQVFFGNTYIKAAILSVISLITVYYAGKLLGIPPTK